MSRACGLQFDSTTPLPFTPALQAFYFNGTFAHRPVSFGRGRVWIDVTGAAPWDCHWADIEAGDIAPQLVPGWSPARPRATGAWGGAYCTRSPLPALLEANPAQPFDLWLATLDGTDSPAAIPELDHLPGHVRLCAIQAYPAGMAGFN